MTGEKKKTIKSLSQEIDILKEQVKEIPLLKQKLSEFEKVINDLKLRKDITEEENLRELIKCIQCDKSFDLKKKLKKHLRETHPRSVKCKTCDKVFSENCELEVHIKTDHQEINEYGCDHCDKKFVLKWRLSKHRQNHSNKLIKKCHYFNNGKICPYEAIGCMFAHEIADSCKFGQICGNKLCSYTHSSTQTRKGTTIKEPRHKQGENPEREKFKCNKCELVFENKDDLTIHEHEDHITRTNLNGHDADAEDDQFEEHFPCESCDKVFVEIEDLIDHYGETGHNI